MPGAVPARQGVTACARNPGATPGSGPPAEPRCGSGTLGPDVRSTPRPFWRERSDLARPSARHGPADGADSGASQAPAERATLQDVCGALRRHRLPAHAYPRPGPLGEEPQILPQLLQRPGADARWRRDRGELPVRRRPWFHHARLASAAGAGELLITDAAAREAAIDTTGWERRSLQLKGKIEPVPVVVLTAEVRARVE